MKLSADLPFRRNCCRIHDAVSSRGLSLARQQPPASQGSVTPQSYSPVGEKPPQPRTPGTTNFAIPAFSILPVMRADGQQSVEHQVPADASSVDLRFSVGTDTTFPEYRVAMRSGGREILSQAGLHPRVIGEYRTVSVRLPVTAAGTYEATVFGRSDFGETAIEDYVFSLKR